MSHVDGFQPGVTPRPQRGVLIPTWSRSLAAMPAAEFLAAESDDLTGATSFTNIDDSEARNTAGCGEISITRLKWTLL